ncbi:lysosomal phospholipase A and acyltransferase-like [Macrobrachium rosenbergii]|uniref:lysosomal phospholipase A and acyltransferase-like n=1 Tax=Macrobrachium rosenbergii TaxID=79674 RepID=UPI0034D739F0
MSLHSSKAVLGLLFLTVALASPLPPSSRFKPPVILIPGFGGSQIEAKLDDAELYYEHCANRASDWTTLWVNVHLMDNYVDCWDDLAKLKYDKQTHTTSNPPGVHTRIPGFGNTTTLEYLTPNRRHYSIYMATMIEAVFLPLGYKRGVDLRGAPYDFRKAPNEMQQYFENLREHIEEMYHETSQKVVMLSHSMGSNIAHYFLIRQTQEWKDRHIETLVSVSGAWGGTVKALQGFTTGYDLKEDAFDILKMREAEETFPSFAYMLPSRGLWAPEEVIIQSGNASFTVYTYKELFEALNLEDGYNMYLDTKDLIQYDVAPGVFLHCITGNNVSTPEGFFFPENDFRQVLRTSYGDGDGTVNQRSLDLCLQWGGLQEQEVRYETFDNAEHVHILQNANFTSYLKELIIDITNENELDSQNLLGHVELEKAEEETRMASLFREMLWGRALSRSRFPREDDGQWSTNPFWSHGDIYG